MYCDSYRCIIIKNPEGYFLNLEDSQTNNLLFCNNNSCEISTQTNGYFINKLNDVIQCHNSKCNNFKAKEYCDSDSYYQVILYKNSAYYCNRNNKISFPSTEKYYEISNISAKSIYPEVQYGNDIILIKIDKYSITQYLTNNDGNI